MTPTAPWRVAIVGARGRIGGRACEWVREAQDLELVAEIGRGDELAGRLADAGVQVGLDLSVAGLGAAHGLTMIEQGVRPVIGTSGVSLEQNRSLDEAARARGLGGLVVPNFSLGVWVLMCAAREAARHFGTGEIIELHDVRKKDAPSGTAVATAELMARVWGLSGSGDVPIHSVRIPGLYSNQEVVFGGQGEVLRLRHETYEASCFAPGVLAALRFVPTALGVGRGIGPAFEQAASRGRS